MQQAIKEGMNHEKCVLKRKSNLNSPRGFAVFKAGSGKSPIKKSGILLFHLLIMTIKINLLKNAGHVEISMQKIFGHLGRDMKVKILTAAFAVLLGMAGKAHAAHPLITDDAGTQGKGKAQLEMLGEYDHEKKDGVTTDSIVAPTIPVLSYGMTDATDIVFGISYRNVRTSDSQNTTTLDGISDASIELKWRFYENDGLSFALKPGITLPTGNDEKGLGAGRATSHLFFITTKEVKPWAFHLNLGYIRNENKVDERINIWHASLAGVVDVFKNMKAVTNIGIESDRDKASNVDPAFILGGFIYSLSENLDFDIGIKKGLNNHGTDYSIPAGITWRY